MLRLEINSTRRRPASLRADALATSFHFLSSNKPRVAAVYSMVVAAPASGSVGAASVAVI